MFTKKLERIIKRNYYFAYNLEYLRYKRAQDPRKEPLIVFQMGKVGSSSAVATLKQVARDKNIYLVHGLSSSYIEKVYRMYKSASRVYKRSVVDKHLLASRYLRHLLDQPNKGERWKVITLTRDPIARNISVFFQAFPIHYPEVTLRFQSQAISVDDKVKELIKLFIYDFDKHDVPIEWFDKYMKPTFGLDVYAVKFDPVAGYHIYKGDHVDLLLIRLEDLNDVAVKAFRNFMKVENVTLQNTNISKDKKYSDEYGLFKQNVVLPREYIDSMYNTKYMKHFYSGEEIFRLRQKWGYFNKAFS